MGKQLAENISRKLKVVSYPGWTLERSIQGVRTVKEKLGTGPFSRESAAQALNYTGLSGASSTAIASLVHYGLLDRRGDIYEVSALADRILVYRDEEEQRLAIVEAAQRPKIFNSLLEKYNGATLPAMIEHIIVRDYGIKQSAAKEIKKKFLDAMMYAGIFQNGVLNKAVVPEGGSPSGGSESGETTWKQSAVNPPNQNNKVNSPNYQNLKIAEGFELSHPSEVLIDLIANEKFVSALKDLKEAIDGVVNKSKETPPKG